MNIRFLASLLLACTAPALCAEDLVIYRCIDASGHLTVQNAPCPKGSRSERRVMQPIATVPMAGPATTAPAPAPPAAAKAPATQVAATGTGDAPPNDAAQASAAAPAVPADAVPRLPPPALYQCTTWQRDSYLTEDSEPARRCIPLQTVGLDGSPASGAGQACDVVYDQCTQVAEDALCRAWRKRLGEVDVALRFGRSEQRPRHQAEFERISKLIAGSSCAQAD